METASSATFLSLTSRATENKLLSIDISACVLITFFFFFLLLHILWTLSKHLNCSWFPNLYSWSSDLNFLS